MSASKRLAVFHHLPSGGGVRVAGQLITALADKFRVTVHHPEGSASLKVPDSVPVREWPFPEGRRLSGARRLAAPFVLSARLDSLDSLCRRIAGEINGSADAVLVHNSMLVAAPPILKYLDRPSVYFCYEYPRHLYEPDLIRRVSGLPARLMLAPLRRKEKRMDLASVAAANRVVTFSRWMSRLISRIYGRDPAIVHPGVDPDEFHPVPVSKADDHALSVGALWPFKGHELALDALASLPREGRPGLVIVADRELPGYVDRLRSKAEREGIELRIRMRISDGELREAYSAALMVLCCQHREPYGLVPLEAMACGTPVIAVPEGGFTDNVHNGKNGLISEREPASMGRAISRLRSDLRLRRKLISGGFDFVSAERSVEGGARELASVIAESI